MKSKVIKNKNHLKSQNKKKQNLNTSILKIKPY